MQNIEDKICTTIEAMFYNDQEIYKVPRELCTYMIVLPDESRLRLSAVVTGEKVRFHFQHPTYPIKSWDASVRDIDVILNEIKSEVIDHVNGEAI